MFAFLKRKYTNLVSDTRFSEILTGSVWALSGRVIATALGLAFSVLVARLYGAEVVGIVAVINSFLMLATIFTVLGTPTSILRLIPEHLAKYSPTSAFKVYRKTHWMVIGISVATGTLSTKPFGYMPFYPGPGLGGHCIPIDPFYLTWKAREYDVATRFIELAGEINTAMPYFVVQRAADVLNEHSKSIKGARILLLGLAYKANVDDDRESPTYRIMDLLEQKGAHVDYNDPYVPEIRPSRAYVHYAGRQSCPITNDYDLIVLCTAHNQYENINPATLNVPLLDTRGFFPDLPGKIHRG